MHLRLLSPGRPVQRFPPWLCVENHLESVRVTASAGPFRDSGGARVSVILRGSHATLTAGRGEGPWSSPSRAVCPPAVAGSGVDRWHRLCHRM